MLRRTLHRTGAKIMSKRRIFFSMWSALYESGRLCKRLCAGEPKICQYRLRELSRSNCCITTSYSFKKWNHTLLFFLCKYIVIDTRAASSAILENVDCFIVSWSIPLRNMFQLVHKWYPMLEKRSHLWQLQSEDSPVHSWHKHFLSTIWGKQTGVQRSYSLFWHSGPGCTHHETRTRPPEKGL